MSGRRSGDIEALIRELGRTSTGAATSTAPTRRSQGSLDDLRSQLRAKDDEISVLRNELAQAREWGETRSGEEPRLLGLGSSWVGQTSLGRGHPPDGLRVRALCVGGREAGVQTELGWAELAGLRKDLASLAHRLQASRKEPPKRAPAEPVEPPEGLGPRTQAAFQRQAEELSELRKELARLAFERRLQDEALARAHTSLHALRNARDT